MKVDINPVSINPNSGLFPNKKDLRQIFDSGEEARYFVSRDIESRINQVFSKFSSPPTVKVRLKKFPSYYRKYLQLRKTGVTDPHITDLIGIRVICPFLEDITVMADLLKDHFDVIDVEQKGNPHNFKEFGYESIHLLIKIPPDIVQTQGRIGCEVAEIQIRTILQDAWAEVEHELVYKAEFKPYDARMKRKLAAVNASLSLADIIFQEFRFHQKRLDSQLGKRRETFFRKIEESTDALLFSDVPIPKTDQPAALSFPPQTIGSIDDLLLKALSAHNKNRFEEAIALYSHILELKPESSICSLIYKHRGMANFAQSHYKDAIADFTSALDLDAKSYKAAYYRGVVYSVLRQYSEAIDDFTMSLEIKPYQNYCLLRRGQAYYHTGDYPQALSDCESSLSVEPENEPAKKFRVLLQNKLKM